MMDEICGLLDALCTTLCRNGLPPIPYIGPASGVFHNPPAPHIELAFIEEGTIREVQIGPQLSIDIPSQHISIHNVHFGNHSRTFPGVRSLCLFFDISAIPDLRTFSCKPFAQVLPVSNPFSLANAFHKARERCIALSGSGGTYPQGDFGYAPSQQTPGSVASKWLFLSSLLDILATVRQDAEGRSAHGLSTDLPLAVRLALDFMIAHYARTDLQLEDIARSAHLSIPHFGRLFKQSTGTSPMAWLQTLRIQRAEFLLMQPTLRIHEVAERTGFKDPYHFSRVFRQMDECSPRQFRIRHKT